MRGTTLRMKAEQLLGKARRAKSPAAVLGFMESLCEVILADNRKRVTDELRGAVIEAHKHGATVSEIVVTIGLSPPTIRKIIKEHNQ